MTKILAIITVVVLTLSLVPRLAADEPVTTAGPNAADMASVDQDSLIEAIQARIAGKENQPAEEVFENIEILAGFPAGRVPMIMKFGFSRSLGVDCTHCHDVQNMASEIKPEKQVAREMWKLSGEVNGLLAAIPNLDSEQPVVNCTTCHRGQKKPATNLD